MAGALVDTEADEEWLLQCLCCLEVRGRGCPVDVVRAAVTHIVRQLAAVFKKKPIRASENPRESPLKCP